MNTAHCKHHDVACKSVIKAFVKQVVAVVPNLTMLGTIRRIAALQVHHPLAACLAEGAQQLEPPDKRCVASFLPTHQVIPWLHGSAYWQIPGHAAMRFRLSPMSFSGYVVHTNTLSSRWAKSPILCIRCQAAIAHGAPHHNSGISTS